MTRSASARNVATVRVAGVLVLTALVGFIYRQAVASYFSNDDFHWLQGTASFSPAGWFDLDRYNHFYRPVIETYFYIGRRIFGCAALPFHLASIAIHLLNTAILFAFARHLTGREDFAAAAALLFAVQPGYVEAVAWVAAITDLLPALWYLIALLMFLRFVRTRAARYYAGALVSFALCLLTHESSATLIAMLIALEATIVLEGTAVRVSPTRRAIAYVPFALLLAGYLAIAIDVNSRSYLVQEGYYAFGFHAFTNVLNYIIWLYVGERELASYVAIAAVTAALIWRGTPRVRFFTIWIFVTLAPVSFFTWGGASRYLYVPAAGFALLLAEGIVKLHSLAHRRLSPPQARAVAAAVAIALAVRFVVFAQQGAYDFRQRTLPYERFATALRAANPAPSSDSVLSVDAQAVDGIPALYYDAAAQTIFCQPGVRVVVR